VESFPNVTRNGPAVTSPPNVTRNDKGAARVSRITFGAGFGRLNRGENSGRGRQM
jgi:hypothetical protein